MVTWRPDARSSSAICRPVADAPTTSTPPLARPVRVAVVVRRDRVHRLRQRRGDARQLRQVERAGGQDDGLSAPTSLEGWSTSYPSSARRTDVTVVPVMTGAPEVPRRSAR